MRNRTLLRLSPLALLAAAGCLYGTFTLSDADTTITGDPGDRFGFRVADVGDLSGDGYTDLAVAAPHPGSDRVYVFKGPFSGKTALSSLDTSSAWYFQGDSGGEAGWSIARGDVYGKAGDELIIGAPSERSGYKGRVHVVSSMPARSRALSATATFEGSNTSEYAGWDVSSGDINGDGWGDLIVGSCGYLSFRGKVSVVYGPIAAGTHSLRSAADVIITGSEDSGAFGCAVEAADLDGDGTDELIVGAERQSLVPETAPGAHGKVHVFHEVPAGSHYQHDLPHDTYVGAFSTQMLGMSLDAGGDVNGDGYEDFVMGAPAEYCNKYDDHPASAGGSGCYIDDPVGSAYLVLGSPDRYDSGSLGELMVEDVADFVIQGTTDRGELGYQVSMGGDLNGDGYDDVVIGSRSQHRAWIFYGYKNVGTTYTSAEDDLNAVGIIDGAAEGTWAGLSVDITPDLDGDGGADLLIGAPAQEWYADGPQSVAGAAYLYKAGI